MGTAEALLGTSCVDLVLLWLLDWLLTSQSKEYMSLLGGGSCEFMKAGIRELLLEEGGSCRLVKEWIS